MHMQTIDAGTAREALEAYLVSSGYWKDTNRRKRHTYVLSPALYVATAAQQESLERMARATYAAVSNLSRTLSALARQRSLTNAEARFHSLALSARRGLATPDEMNGCVPPIMKVDLVQDAEGSYRIVEVDAYNPRGIGYFALLEGTLPPQTMRLGSGLSVVTEMVRQSIAGVGQLALIVSDYEGYYATVFEIFADKLRAANIPVRLVNEGDIERVFADDKDARAFMIPESLFRNESGRDLLLRKRLEGSLRTLFPPTAYLGSKAFLPYLATQEGMSEFIPPTSLVSKRDNPLLVCNGGPYVLKAVMSSGLKQIHFSQDGAAPFAAALTAARSTKRPGWIMQQQVPQSPIPVTVFEDDGRRITREYYVRLTAYISAEGLVGIEVTGRPDTKVHGAPDCIQIPVVAGI